jgi:hypothetical protein
LPSTAVPVIHLGCRGVVIGVACISCGWCWAVRGCSLSCPHSPPCSRRSSGHAYPVVNAQEKGRTCCLHPLPLLPTTAKHAMI